MSQRLEHDWLAVDLPHNVDLDPSTYLHSAYAFNHYRSELPCGVRIGEHTALYDAAMFELGPAGSVEIGAYRTVYGTQFVTNSRIVIGDFAYLSYEVYLSDIAWPQVPAEHKPVAGPDPAIVIGDDCWVGMRSVLLAGARLGDGVIVGAGSVVNFEVPAYSIVAGNPASVVAQVPRRLA